VENYEYFFFNRENFTGEGVLEMNREVGEAGRGIVVIVDPHIKASPTYPVFAEGMQLQNQQNVKGNLSNIFVQDAND